MVAKLGILWGVHAFGVILSIAYGLWQDDLPLLYLTVALSIMVLIFIFIILQGELDALDQRIKEITDYIREQQIADYPKEQTNENNAQDQEI